MDEGWIKLHRKILSWEWYLDINVRVTFFHLLIKANHLKKRWMGIEIDRGQVLIGRKKLSKEIGISEQSLRTSLNKLKSTNEITIESTNKFSIITICNFDTYNDISTPTNQQNNQLSNKRLTSNQPTTNQQLTTTKNEKNIKNEKNVKNNITDVKTSDHQKIIEIWINWYTGKYKDKPLINSIEGKAVKDIIKHFKNLAGDNGTTDTPADLFGAIMGRWDIQEKWIRENVDSLKKFSSQINTIIKNARRTITKTGDFISRANEY